MIVYVSHQNGIFTESPAPTPVTNTAVSPATPAGSTPATPTPTYKPTTVVKDEEKILAEFKVYKKYKLWILYPILNNALFPNVM